MGLRLRFWLLRIAASTGIAAAALLSSGSILRPAPVRSYHASSPGTGQQCVNGQLAASASRRGVPHIRADLFGPLAASEPAAQDAAITQVPPSLPGTPPDPVAGYVFTGIAEIGGRQCALIEDRNTHEGQYVRVGDRLGGFLVRSFNKDGVLLECGNALRVLAMNANYSLVPLSRYAWDTSPVASHDSAPQSAPATPASWGGPPAGTATPFSFGAPAAQTIGSQTVPEFTDTAVAASDIAMTPATP